MKRSETQSLYKALPGQYISYDFSPIEKSTFLADKAVIRIAYWNKEEISPDEIYPPKIVDQVCSNLSDFFESQNSMVIIDPPIQTLISSGHKGYKTRVRFVQAIVNKNKTSNNDNETPQIYGNINPKMYYCKKCGKIKILRQNSDIKEMRCCHGHKMEQYLRAWICSCGESLSVDNYDIREGDIYIASEPNGVTGKDRQRRRLQRKCPKCGAFMALENVTDNKTFYPRTITTIKLYDNNYAKLCESEQGRQLILKKYKKEISKDVFRRKCEELLNRQESNSDTCFDDVLDDGSIIDKLLNGINDATSESIEQTDKEVVYKILEYDTLTEKKNTDLNGAIEKAIRLNRIHDKECVNKLATMMKIQDIYSVSGIEVVNTAYGYTRKYQSPEVMMNPNDKLVLRAFTEKSHPGVPIFYNIRNETEGIVIDIDKKVMYRHLVSIFSDKYRFKNLKDESEIVDWFLNDNNIDPSIIKTFKSIESDGTLKTEATKAVYSILHTISHIAIQSISRFSGIEKDSLSEMVFPNSCSILIYANTNQAIVLSAITSMFDKQVYELLNSFYEDNKTCSFDPICINDDKSNGSCIACTLLSEAACEHFNKDLGRRFLYGYHNGSKNIDGFWEEK